MRVIYVCEHSANDEHILTPFLKTLFFKLERPHVRVEPAKSDLVNGIRDALNPVVLNQVLAKHRPYADAYFLLVDRDGEEGREAGAVERLRRELNLGGKPLFPCFAIEEVEVWALALHRAELEREWSHDWVAIRTERDVKESVFVPFVTRKNWHLGPGRGRRTAMKEVRAKWDSLKALCPEVQQLVEEVRDWIAGTSPA